jgi:hypothetical protein
MIAIWWRQAKHSFWIGGICILAFYGCGYLFGFLLPIGTAHKFAILEHFPKIGCHLNNFDFHPLSFPSHFPTSPASSSITAEVRRSNIHPSVHKLTAWRKRNRLSQRAAVAVLQKYYFDQRERFGRNPHVR